MIPSDHFVRFYNEVFKFLANCNGLEEYYQSVSEHQELHCLETFTKNGLKGMYDYWEKIRIEENCLVERELTEDCLHTKMLRCPSLSKVLDNDAAFFEGYCDHCSGWVLPLLKKAGYYSVRNLIDRRLPVCESFIYKDKDRAKAKLHELLNSVDDKTLISSNLE